MTFKEILENLTGGRPAWPDGTGGAKADLSFDIALVVRLVISCIIFSGALLIRRIPAPWPSVMLIVSALIAGADLLAGAILAVMNGRFLDKSVLVLLSTVIAFIFGAAVEGAALVLLFQLGGIFISYAVVRTRMTALSAVNFQNEYATVIHDGGEDRVPAGDVQPGERIRLRAGERVPCDCLVVEGESSLDLSDMGGSEGEVAVKPGDELLSGSLNTGDELVCEVTGTSAESTAALFYNSVARASASGGVCPAPLEKAASYFTPVVCVIAVLIAALLPLALHISVAESVRRAAVFLIVANPCALLIAVPLIRLCSVSGAARSGVLCKDCSAMDTLADAGAVAFSKPGTLTDGELRVVSIKPSARMNKDVLLKIVAHAMAYSNTPQARAVIAAYGGTIYIDLVQNFTDIPGSGVEVTVDGIRICAGTRDLMTVKHVSVPDGDLTEEYAVYAAIGDEYAGRIVLSDNVRPDAATGVSELARCGVGKVVMFTDESRDSAARAAASLGIVEYYSEHGVKRTREAIGEVKRGCATGENLVFVGAPECFTAGHTDADSDVAMAGLDTLAAPVGADITIIGGKVERLPLAIAISRYSGRLMAACMAFALLVKLVLLLLGFFGIATLWFAVFIDACAAVGASLASILAFNGESYSK